jgi:hypothetical protein
MNLWAVDSHVHFHKCYDEGLFFDSCFNNLIKFAPSSVKNGLLFFTEGRNEDSFNFFKTKKKIKSTLNEKIDYIVNLLTDEKIIELKWIESGMRVIMLQGFQIVTKENLEVLSLGTNKRLPDGNSIENTISDVLSLGGIPVLPWGFGKWYGNRGKKIDELIMKRIPNLFLGDNGGRTTLLPNPPQFKLAEANGLEILPGSDPLPFLQEAKRPMSYGFLTKIDFDEERPWESVQQSLLDESLNIEKFGDLTSPLAFIKTQLVMQVRKIS